MVDKAILLENIKQWITIDNKIELLQKNLKELKTVKQKISGDLINIMSKNDIDEFETTNGKIIHRKTKVKGTINKKYLLDKLEEYFENNPQIDTNDVGSFILDNRPIKENSSLIIKKKT